jgi:hypothetical protein
MGFGATPQGFNVLQQPPLLAFVACAKMAKNI